MTKKKVIFQIDQTATDSLTQVDKSSSCVNDFFFNTANNFTKYNEMLTNYVNYHGLDSDKVRQLIWPDNTLVDRVYNLHCLTGSTNQMPWMVYKTLETKKSISDISTISSLCTENSSIATVCTENSSAISDTVTILQNILS